MVSRPGALATIYEAHVDQVFRHLHRMGVPKRDIPDLTQETFLVVQRRLADLDPSQAIAGWLWGIALGLARNHRRKVRRHAESPLIGEVAISTTPEHDAARSELRGRLVSALDDLDPEKRAVFVMFEIEGLSGQTIADELGVPVGTVHSRLFAARKELMSALEDHAPARAEAP
jgi:RNA polymerase sigma-70 factor, ECF subfamily